MISSTHQNQPSIAISEDNMATIIDAILDGKYSYACLIALEAAGYEPTQYIPYRTYNRLQKQRQAKGRKTAPIENKVSHLNSVTSELDYIEPIGAEEASVSGGHSHRWDEYSQDNVLFWPI